MEILLFKILMYLNIRINRMENAHHNKFHTANLQNVVFICKLLVFASQKKKQIRKILRNKPLIVYCLYVNQTATP